MTSLLKQRLIGAIVLISLGIIFIPMLLTGKGNILTGEEETNVPPKPMYEIKAPSVLPLEKNQAATEPVVEPVAGQLRDGSPPESSPATPIEGQPQSPAAAEPDITTSPANGNSSAAVVSAAEGERAKDQTIQAAPEKSTTGQTTKSANTATAADVAAAVATATKSQSVKTKPPATVAKLESEPVRKPIVSGWVVQLGSFSVEKNATQLRDRLRKKGHASFVEKYAHNGKTSYRVRVGPELTRELAEKLKQTLKKETKLNGLVMAFPSK